MRLQDKMFAIESQDDNELRLRLNPEQIIYRAHFPGNPITPGVCLIQMVGELLQTKYQCMLNLKRVVNLKFVAIISPIKQPVIDVKFTQTEDTPTEVKAKGNILYSDNVMTKFSLIFEKR